MQQPPLGDAMCRHLYWLGAGASAPVGAPLSRELLERVRLVLDARKSTASSEGSSKASPYGKALQALDMAPQGLGIEEVFSTLADPFWSKYVLRATVGDVSDALRALRFAVAIAIRDSIAAKGSALSLERFYRDVVHPGDVIVTTNYDDVSEFGLGPKWGSYWENQGVSPGWGGPVKLSESKVLVVHLHGSYLTTVCERGHEEFPDRFDDWSDPEITRNAAWAELDKLASLNWGCSEPVEFDEWHGKCSGALSVTVVPPVSNKGAFSRSVDFEWGLAYSLPTNFSGLTIVGWSANPVDVEARALLRHLIRANRLTRVDVVTRDGGASPALETLLDGVSLDCRGGGIEAL